jgi:hypothetical protein
MTSSKNFILRKLCRFICEAFLIMIILEPNSLIAQQKINAWLFGMQPTKLVSSQPDTGEFKEFGGNYFDFSVSPFFEISHIKSLGNSWNIVNMWDNNGNLLFYSNGSKVFNAQHQLIENADSLNYSNYG